jgi:hypothetical protein
MMTATSHDAPLQSSPLHATSVRPLRHRCAHLHVRDRKQNDFGTSFDTSTFLSSLEPRILSRDRGVTEMMSRGAHSCHAPPSSSRQGGASPRCCETDFHRRSDVFGNLQPPHCLGTPVQRLSSTKLWMSCLLIHQLIPHQMSHPPSSHGNLSHIRLPCFWEVLMGLSLAHGNYESRIGTGFALLHLKPVRLPSPLHSLIYLIRIHSFVWSYQPPPRTYGTTPLYVMVPCVRFGLSLDML